MVVVAGFYGTSLTISLWKVFSGNKGQRRPPAWLSVPKVADMIVSGFTGDEFGAIE